MQPRTARRGSTAGIPSPLLLAACAGLAAVLASPSAAAAGCGGPADRPPARTGPPSPLPGAASGRTPWTGLLPAGLAGPRPQAADPGADRVGTGCPRPRDRGDSPPLPDGGSVPPPAPSSSAAPWTPAAPDAPSVPAPSAGAATGGPAADATVPLQSPAAEPPRSAGPQVPAPAVPSPPAGDPPAGDGPADDAAPGGPDAYRGVPQPPPADPRAARRSAAPARGGAPFVPAGSAAPDGAAPAAATSALPGPGGLPGADGPTVPVAGADDAAPPFSAVAAGTYLPLGMGLGMVGAGVALVGLRLRRG